MSSYIPQFYKDVMIHPSPKWNYHGHVDEEVLKQSPHVVAGVDLLHLHLSVDVTMVQEVDVRVLHLKKIRWTIFIYWFVHFSKW